MKKPTVRASYLSFALLLEELLSGPSTAKALADHTGMGHRYMCRLLATLYSKKVIHISGWERDALGRAGVRVYALGQGKDAKKPLKTRQAINRDHRRKVSRDPLKGTPFYGLTAANEARRVDAA